MLYPNALDDVALDVHSQNVSGMQTHFVGIVGQLNTTSFSTTADLHLSFHYNWVLRCIGNFHCFINSDCYATR